MLKRAKLDIFISSGQPDRISIVSRHGIQKFRVVHARATVKYHYCIHYILYTYYAPLKHCVFKGHTHARTRARTARTRWRFKLFKIKRYIVL